MNKKDTTERESVQDMFLSNGTEQTGEAVGGITHTLSFSLGKQTAGEKQQNCCLCSDRLVMTESFFFSHTLTHVKCKLTVEKVLRCFEFGQQGFGLKIHDDFNAYPHLDIVSVHACLCTLLSDLMCTGGGGGGWGASKLDISILFIKTGWRQWAQTNGQSGKREETLPMGQPLREDILPMGQCRERTGKIHIGPSALPPLYSDKIFKSSHYFTLGYSVEMPGRKPQNVYMHTQFWCIDSYIKMSSSH